MKQRGYDYPLGAEGQCPSSARSAAGWLDTWPCWSAERSTWDKICFTRFKSGDHRFGCNPLEAIDLLAACHPTLMLGSGGAIEIGRLSSHRLLLLDGSFVLRRTFDAACRFAGFQPNIKFESRAPPHTLLVLQVEGMAWQSSPRPCRRLGTRCELSA
jgi:LysR substrate binding domain